jgi:putative hydrolase of the HAD superfamily
MKKKYEAVIFDLFGTLIENFSRPEYESVLAEMASILKTPFQDFQRVWLDSFPERVTGVHTTQKESIRHICRELNVRVTEAQVEDAFEIRLDYSKRAMIPRPGAVETLSRLKSDGHKMGLISDCSGEIPIIWKSTPFVPFFQVTVFSCVANMKKPDPRIYYLATDELKVRPQDCLYIGDGSSKELTGALKVGMHPVLIRDPDESPDAHYIDREDDWPGTRISSLSEVLSLVK